MYYHQDSLIFTEVSDRERNAPITDLGVFFAVHI